MSKKSVLHIGGEENPNDSVLAGILGALEKDKLIKGLSIDLDKLNLAPVMEENAQFTHVFSVEGVKVEGYDKIVFTLIRGSGSFVDYVILKRPSDFDIYSNEPHSYHAEDVIALIEVTKTTDAESRNCATSQRNTKFVLAREAYPEAALIMYYDHAESNERIKMSASGNSMLSVLKTLGVSIHGKNVDAIEEYKNIDEVIEAKSQIKCPTSGQRIILSKDENDIFISIKLNKGDKNRIAHDPNIGAAVSYCAVFRKLGWKGNITIVNHHVEVGPNEKNKFIQICNLLDIRIEGQVVPITKVADFYCKQDKHTEKIATITMHNFVRSNPNFETVFENHAGSERGYFRCFTKGCSLCTNKTHYQVPKTTKLPDLVIKDEVKKKIYLCEGEMGKRTNIANGKNQLNDFASFEALIALHYPDFTIEHYLIVNGGTAENVKQWADGHEILFHIDDNSKVYYHDNVSPLEAEQR